VPSAIWHAGNPDILIPRERPTCRCQEGRATRRLATRSRSENRARPHPRTEHFIADGHRREARSGVLSRAARCRPQAKAAGPQACESRFLGSGCGSGPLCVTPDQCCYPGRVTANCSALRGNVTRMPRKIRDPQQGPGPALPRHGIGAAPQARGVQRERGVGLAGMCDAAGGRVSLGARQRRGMEFVGTINRHDTIEAVLEIADRPEPSCRGVNPLVPQ